MKINLELDSFKLKDVKKAIIKKAIDHHKDCRIQDLAKILGISRSSLYRDLEQYGFEITKTFKTLSEIPASPNNQTASDFIVLKLAADRYSISTSFLYKLYYQKRIKFYKLGSMTYLKISELEALFQPK